MKVGMFPYDKEDIFISNWLITRKCNFSCKYCRYCDTKNNSTSESGTIDKIIEFYNTINSIKPVDLIIVGGEPTLENLEHVLSRLTLHRPVEIFSNLSKPAEYYINLNSIKPIKISCSYHNSNFKIFIDKIKLLSSNIPITAKFMVHYNDLSIIDKVNGVLYPSNNLRIEFNPIYNPLWTNDSKLKIIKANLNKIYYVNDKLVSYYELYNINNFKYWKCFVGTNGCVVDYDGRIYYCKTFLFSNKPAKYTVFGDYLNILDKNIICPHSSCTAELEIPKESSILSKIKE